MRIPAGILRAKGNDLVVEATSLGANRVRHIYRTNGVWKKFADYNLYNYDYKKFNADKWPVRSCGLLGPLSLREPGVQ